MGIIIGDTITLINGLSAQNTYGSFGDSILTLEKIEEITVDENNVETPSNIYTLSCKVLYGLHKIIELHQNPRLIV